MAKKIIGIIVAFAVIAIIIWVIVRKPERPAPEEVLDEATEAIIHMSAGAAALAADSIPAEVSGADSVEDVR